MVADSRKNLTVIDKATTNNLFTSFFLFTIYNYNLPLQSIKIITPDVDLPYEVKLTSN